MTALAEELVAVELAWEPAGVLAWAPVTAQVTALVMASAPEQAQVSALERVLERVLEVEVTDPLLTPSQHWAHC